VAGSVMKFKSLLVAFLALATAFTSLSFATPFDSTWSVRPCDGAGTGTNAIVNGVLQIRQTTPGGDDNNYG